MALETIDFFHAVAEAGIYVTEKTGCKSSVLFFLCLMGQQGVRFPEEPSELSPTKTALLFPLYVAGAEHHIIPSARGVKLMPLVLLYCKNEFLH